MNCKNCGYEMIIPIFRLDSNDSRMTGDYCSKKCIDKRRESIPPFRDLGYLRKKEEEESVKEPVIEPAPEPEPMITDEAEAEVWKNLFG